MRIGGIALSKFGRAEIVIEIKNIGEERFRKYLFLVHFLQLLCHEEALECNLVPGAGHTENPWDPLEEQHLNLNSQINLGCFAFLLFLMDHKVIVHHMNIHLIVYYLSV